MISSGGGSGGFILTQRPIAAVGWRKIASSGATNKEMAPSMRARAVNLHIMAVGICALAVSLSTMPSHAQCRAASADHQVAVFELYTSEGCDSCPPADRWFSGLKRDAEGQRGVALAFHVDYWDRLGWKDRFGSAAYTERQHDQAGRQHAPFVYTPQILLQGQDFPSWRATPSTGAVDAINAKPAAAKIELAASRVERKATAVDVRVRVRDPRDRAHAAIAVALVQDGLASEVKAGENAGKRLAHDHVVRQWREDSARFDASGEAIQRIVLTLPDDAGPMSIVALVEDASTGAVLQAMSLPLCDR